jgi:hypothetical protein
MANFEINFQNKYPWYTNLLNQYMNLFYVFIDYNLSDRDLHDVFVDKLEKIEESKKIYRQQIYNIEKDINWMLIKENIYNEIIYLESVNPNTEQLIVLKKEHEKFAQLYHYKFL